MAAPTIAVEDQLDALVERLTAEYADVKAAKVARCVARSVRSARAWGCPEQHLVAAVEASARWRLNGGASD